MAVGCASEGGVQVLLARGAPTSGRNGPRLRQVLALLLITSILSGCGIARDLGKPAAQHAVEALDEAISRLDSESQEWRAIVAKAIEDLPEEFSQTIRADLQNVLARTIALANAAAQCFVDYLADRLQLQLARFRASLLGLSAPVLPPLVCQVTPSEVDLSLDPQRRQRVDFFGHDFDADPAVQAFHVSSTGTVTNVSNHLSSPSHYQMQLNLSGNGVPLDATSKIILLRWGNTQISSVNVEQPLPPTCQSEGVDASPITVSLVPKYTGGGDREFDGNGPDILVKLKIFTRTDTVETGNESRIVATYSMRAKETKSDWTLAESEKTKVVWSAPADWTIERIVGQVVDELSVRDGDKDAKNYKGLFADFKVIGDTPGEDIGETSVRITFHKIPVILRQIANCRAP